MGVKVGTFAQKTSAGTQVISGLGFQPEIILFFSSGALASGSYEVNHRAMYGMSVGTAAGDNGSVSTSSQDAQTTGAHKSTGRAAQKAITFCQYDDTVVAEADMDSIDSDGFTLDWTTADANARIINYIAVSGFDSVKIVEWTQSTGSGNESVTGVGFIPDLVINIGEQNLGENATPYAAINGGIGLAAFDDTTQWAMSTWDKETVDNISRSAQSNAAMFTGVNVSGNLRNATFVSMDSDGFTINLAATFTPPQKAYALCLKGGPQFSLGTITKANNQRGPVVQSIGFRPGGLILASANPPTIAAADTDVKTSIGVADRDDQHSMEFFVDQLATSDVGMINITNRTVLINDNHDSTVETQAHADHFNSDGFQLNWGKDANPVAYINYIAFEETIANRTGEALKVFTGVFDKKTSNGTQAITGIGFTPKVLLCWYGGSTADDTWQDFLRRGFGAATSPTNRYACGDAAEEDLTTSNCQVIKSPAHVISIVSPSGSIEGEADLTSFDSDGFTLEWTNNNATAYKIHYLALGGTDEIEDAKIISFVTSTSNGQQSVTGAGFRPDSVICFGNTRINSQEDGVHVHGGILLGVTDGINHVGTQTFLLDASSTEQHARTTDIDGFLEGTTNTPGEDLHSEFVSMDDDGFTFNQINAGPSPGYRIFALCIKGIYTNTKNFNSEVSTTGDKAYTGVGFQPIGLLTFGSTQSVDDAVATRGILSIGASDGTNDNALMSGAERGIGDMACISKVGSIIVIDTTDPMATLATTEEGTFTSFDSDGFTIDWITSDANAIRNLYIAFERNWIQTSVPLTDVAATALSNLNLSQTSSAAAQIARSLASVLSLIQASRPSIIFKSGSSALGLTQLAQATISFGDVFTPSVTSNLNLTGSSVARNVFIRSATNILAFSQQATNDSIKSHSAANILSFVQILAENFVLASAANTLALTQSSGGSKNISESAANVMALSQTLVENFKLHSAASPIAFTQFVIATVNAAKVISVSNTFSLNQTVTKSIDFIRAFPFEAADDQSQIQLTQAVVVAHNIRVQAANTLGLVSNVQLKEHNEAVTSFLSFSQKMGRVLTVSAANSMFLQQEAARIFKLTSQLNLISSASPVTGRNAVSVIPFVSTATILSDFARILTQDLGIRQAVSYQVENTAGVNVECIYSPFVGDVTSGITPPPTTTPTLGTATLTLTHPFVDSTTTLVLRNPELNNAERLQFARINRTTRGGDLKIFSDPTWPKQETLKVQIEALTTAQKDSLVSFFEDNIGLEIGLLDDENRQWKGIITQPDADFTDVIGNGCTYSVIFEFEGELQ